ncbi:MAG TPA: GGDEF domain-containing protein [Planctomycetota bacterium]|nr:GGDEF domain-containing protein [Planctomycetota bacterium]HRR81669.1 GGDEF domain-containing protein [Planctomycetota bacterium]HRT94491.1 GGDEF domain-containing protein [Planctomycetota bacterium]
MRPNAILLYAGALLAGISLVLGGRQLAIGFTPEAQAMDLAGPILAVVTALLCLAVLDWARNLPRGGGASEDFGEEDDELAAERPAPVSASADKELAAILRVLDDLAGGEPSRDEIAEQGLKAVADFAHASAVTLWLRDDSGAFHARAECADGAVVRRDAPADEADRGPLERLAECRKPLETRGDAAAEFLFPLLNGERCFGALRVEVPLAAGAEGADAVPRLGRRLEAAARALSRALQAPAAYEAAVLDPVTGAYSQRHFVSRLTEAISLCRRYGEPLSLLVIDVDNFRMLNDSFGSAACDRLLHAVASLVKQNIRDADSVYRCGGDEIAVLVPNTEADKARTVAERLRRLLRENRYPADDGTAIIASVSIGVAEFDEDMSGIDPLLAHAGEAVRAAKESGRDRVRVWEPPREVAAEAPSEATAG